MISEKVEKAFRRDGKEITLELKFKNDWHRDTGFRGSRIRKRIDESLPQCPFCRKKPSWEWRDVHVSIKGGPLAKLRGRKIYGGSHWEGRWKEWRLHFRCQSCEAVISQAKNLTSVDQNRSFRLESLGKNENLQHMIDEEYPLEILQEWARR